MPLNGQRLIFLSMNSHTGTRIDAQMRVGRGGAPRCSFVLPPRLSLFCPNSTTPLSNSSSSSSSSITTRGRRRATLHVARAKGFQLDDLEKELDQLPMDVLRNSMDEAIEAEEYEKAALLRDKINEKENKDPVISLRRQLEEAVVEERYEDAARFRDELSRLEPTEPDQGVHKVGEYGMMDGSETMSVKRTEGVLVKVQSIFVPQHSGLTSTNFMFAYKITIVNESHPTTIKLISRRWEIRDQEGRVRLVEGQGVVGEQPELMPGEEFTYQSVCPLETPKGSMSGHFEMYSRASPTGQWNTSFLVDVAEFKLDANGPIFFE